MRIFKFLSPCGAIATLKNCSLRASHPSNFNDPFELEVSLTVPKADEIEIMYRDPILIRRRYENSAILGENYETFEQRWFTSIPVKVARRLAEYREGKRLIEKGAYRENWAKTWYLICASASPTSILM